MPIARSLAEDHQDARTPQNCPLRARDYPKLPGTRVPSNFCKAVCAAAEVEGPIATSEAISAATCRNSQHLWIGVSRDLLITNL